ncbi:PREDICTED: sphingosine kinase 2-like [Eufriesea mexicana]|uniref:sphingosine kinase 2-like n=1 Tax=Eufriesea mexicana TaxID=516756 RepID=UPI00083BB583|nr:PREDICTED: sphingosine kinase 2-like [Eufriesea mexicana]XP_017761074.1 PREDICTED: sphingosine kinase 2-like [Eufriesea mexicana]
MKDNHQRVMEDDGQVHSSTLLEETFYVTSKKNTYYKVRLTEKGLSLEKDSNGATKVETIVLNDIIGCRCMRSKRKSAGSCVCGPGTSRSQFKLVEPMEAYQCYDEFDTSAYLYIYAYTLKKARMKGIKRRERTTITLRFRSFDKYEDNLREASRWRLAIKCLIVGVPVPKSFMSPSHENLESLISACPGEQRKILVLLNPKSGPGRGREIFQKRIHPILSEAERLYEVHISKCPNYAREFVRTRDIYQWSGLLMVGGDGIVFEVVNGLFQRPDWEKTLKELPLGVIPCGSGNGLAKSIAYAKQEPYDYNPLLVSALSVVKFKKAQMDLVRVETRNQILFSFLSVGWGLLADIDIESERLRAIGGQRFTVWTIARLIGLRTYKGKVSYLPCDKVPSVENLGNSKAYNEYAKEAQISHSRSCGDDLDRYSKISESKSFHDALDGDPTLDGSFDSYDDNEIINESITLETEAERRQRLDSFYSATSVKSTYFSTGSISSYHSIDEPNNDEIDVESNSSHVMYGPSSRLPALTSEVSSSWTQIQGEFVMVHAAYQSHLGQDYFFAPRAKLADGIIWLMIVKAGITRANLLQFLLGLSSGTHLTRSGIDMIPVKAFRIEPEEGANGYITVDGERVDYGPLQAEIFPSLATVMSP